MSAGPIVLAGETTTVFIEKLDKQSDKMIREAYEYKPEGFSVVAVYDGNFSGSGEPEKLAIIKVAGQPHAAGLDAHIAAVYDAQTFENISAMYFSTDLFAYHVATAEDGRGYFIYSGYSSGTGLYDYTYAFYEMGNPWMKLHELSDDNEPSQEQWHIALGEDGVATVYKSLLGTQDQHAGHMVMLAEPSYTLTFDPQSKSLVTAEIPEQERNVTYADLESGFYMTIPASWSGLYHLEYDGNAECLVSFVHSASSTLLFNIVRVPPQEVQKVDFILKRVLYETGEFLYALRMLDAVLSFETNKTEYEQLEWDIVSIAESYVMGNAADAGLISKPTPPLIALEPVKDELDLALPEPDKQGFRSYRWNGQLVNDWLGDLAEATELRNLLLPLLDGPMKEDFYYIYMGKPRVLDEGNLLIPAGKRHDGEWMPSLYHISRNEDGRLYINAASYNYPWQITRSRFTTSSGDISTFFGIPWIIDYVAGRDEKLLDPLRITLRFTDGSEASDTLPNSSGYFLITAETGKKLAEIRVENVNTGEIIPWDNTFAGGMWVDEGDDETLALYTNIKSVPALLVNSTIEWDELPKLSVVPRTELHKRDAGVYAARLYDGVKSFYAIAPAPLYEIYLEDHGHLPATMHRYDERMTVTIDYGEWGMPTNVEAVLHENGKTMPLEYTHDPSTDGEPHMAWQIRTPVLKKDVWYMLSVRAEFGDKGYVHWTLPLMR